MVNNCTALLLALVSPFFQAWMFRCLENLRQERRQTRNMSRLFYADEYENVTPNSSLCTGFRFIF